MGIDANTAPQGEGVRKATADVACTVIAPTTLEFQVTVAKVPGLTVNEVLDITLDGAPISAREIVGPHGTRLHQVDAQPGAVRLQYRAEVTGSPDDEPTDEYLRSVYLRPSRFIWVDRFFGFAAKQFPDAETDAEKALAVRQFVAGRLDYIPGASNADSDASETLLASAGVCRDYAHLTIALLRALKVPARMTAVFPPGCDPMDFHAVAEAYVDGKWYVLDATNLAPRQSLLRIATGRDAADIAFLDNHGGSLQFENVEVTATTFGDLPIDDPTELVAMS